MSGEPRLRVLTYNIHGQRDDRAALTDVVRSVAPDVAILQEAPRRWRWRSRSAALADSFAMVVGAGGLPGMGNLLLTSLRVRVLDSWTVRFPLTPGRHLRAAVFARCAVGPARFVVVGSHLSTDPAERPAQARLLRQACADVDDPLILGLDVNDTPPAAGADSPVWREVAAGLTDAAVIGGAGDICTFPCAGPRRRIDAIFVDPRIRVAAATVVDTPAARRASDHFPVVADLVLAGPGTGLDKRGG
ncbi:endonuclease/exonuclease/phosphatase family protein [Solwaraspora sp. WMMD791]|uniref:endonuclease/exonuclease/phosphatase family protein n=1 Tax=Solwaraspora sp. WMMD791 TaxID=3016086 RepID=UPI00249CB1D8|nr:endonuclease/exonuclease/phosphatase family protein [Solwaraspora sp. WMMD791]WFE29501.1 endonuclease/exonuclease/phosphatase family protein [Solwaraspora sp. WMMD791]